MLLKINYFTNYQEFNTNVAFNKSQKFVNTYMDIIKYKTNGNFIYIKKYFFFFIIKITLL